MKRLLIIFCLSFVVLNSVYAQDAYIKRQYVMQKWNPEKKMRCDSTFQVRFMVKNGKVNFADIDLWTFDGKVKKVWLRFEGSGWKAYEPFNKSLKAIRNKFKRWIETAKVNNVKSFSKEIKLEDAPMPKFNFYFEVDDKGYYITPHPRWNPVMTFTPYFIVEDGEAFVQMAFKSCDASRPKDVQGYVPSLWSVVLTHAAGGDEETATFYKFGMAFYSIEEIQGLIDALDISNELQELKEKEHKEQKEKEEIDKLFK